MQHADSREVTGYDDARHLPLIDLVEVVQRLDLGFFQTLASRFLLSNQHPWPEEVDLPEPAGGSPNRFLLEESSGSVPSFLQLRTTLCFARYYSPKKVNEPISQMIHKSQSFLRYSQKCKN
jgi:hypothetical protein